MEEGSSGAAPAWVTLINMFKHSDARILHKEQLGFQEACAHVCEGAWHLALYFNSELFRESICLQKSSSRSPLDAFFQSACFQPPNLSMAVGTGAAESGSEQSMVQRWREGDDRMLANATERQTHVFPPPKNSLKHCQTPKSQEKLWSTLGVSHLSDGLHLMLTCTHRSTVWQIVK